MRNLFSINKKGFSVVEILVAISLAGVMIATIGSALNSVHKLNSRSEMREKALAYAKEYVEIINEKQNDEFGCICHGSCIKKSGISCNCNQIGSTCNTSLLTGYSSCWTEYADGLSQNTPLYLDANHKLRIGSNDPQTNQLIFTRKITIEHPTSDCNKKTISVAVNWKEQGVDKEVKLSTILTGWKNLSNW